MDIILYTTGCDRCKVLKAKLDAKNIQYKIMDDVEKMIEDGFKTVPILEVEGNQLVFSEAIQWVNQQ